MNLPQEPLGIRRTGSSPVFRYSCRHSHFPRVHGWVIPPLHTRRNAPLPIPRPGPYRSPGMAEPYEECRSFGAVLSPRSVTPGLWSVGIRSLAEIGKLVGPLAQPVLYLRH